VYQRPWSGGLFDFLLFRWRAREIVDMMAIQTQTLLEIISSQISVDVIFAINSALML
jgi:hypothetical protein